MDVICPLPPKVSCEDKGKGARSRGWNQSSSRHDPFAPLPLVSSAGFGLGTPSYAATAHFRKCERCQKSPPNRWLVRGRQAVHVLHNSKHASGCSADANMLIFDYAVSSIIVLNCHFYACAHRDGWGWGA